MPPDLSCLCCCKLHEELPAFLGLGNMADEMKQVGFGKMLNELRVNKSGSVSLMLGPNIRLLLPMSPRVSVV